MDEDIDIEEHDILENPRVWNILPHFDNIKEEPMDYEDNYEEYTNDLIEDTEEMDLINECDNYMMSEPDTASSPEAHPSNKITLGTKPNSETKMKYLQVALEDWGPHLERSSCFCKDCKTLFATRNALDSHNMTAHSFLVAMDSPKETNALSQNHKYCNHCHKHFDDYNLLIQHLYDLITAKKNAQSSATPNTSLTTINTQVAEVEKRITAVGKLMTCPICSYYTQYYYNMIRHKKLHHNMEMGKPEYVSFNPSCKFCNFTGQMKDYNVHIKMAHTDHYSRIVSNKESSTSVVAKTESTTPMKTQKEETPKYKCINCKLSFVSREAAQIHKSKVHTAKKFVFKTSKRAVRKNTRKRLSAVDRGFVPKDILFKCDQCPLHFLNGIAGVNHARQRMHRTDIVECSWRCPQCNRLFRRRDRQMHEVQHQFTSIFKVYEVHQNMHSRVLYECVECKVYFDERFFVMHMRRNCYGSSKAEQCAVCEIKVYNLEKHNFKHDQSKFIKSDFILIDDYVSLPEKKKLKSKLPVKPEPVVEVQKPKEGKKMILYYCNLCKIYMKNSNRKDFHRSRQCGTDNRKIHCRVCGLTFHVGQSVHNHMILHNSFNMELKDFSFCSISTLKPIVPPIPVFPTCTKCNIHYLASHTCGESRKICDICKDTFNLTSFKIHVLHHKYLGKGTHISNANSPKTPKKIVFQYEKLKSTWNILYNCNQCGATSDMYDKVVEHCQNHFNNLINSATFMICDICSLSFEEDCYKRHRKLHLQREIDKNSFNISNYDYSNLFKADWFKIFDPLPKEATKQVLSQTMYLTHKVKMRLKFNGPPEYTVYKCEMCKNVIPCKDIESHAMNVDLCTKSELKLECKVCGISFGTLPSLEEHTAVHASKNITIDSFRIVSFNDPSDEKFNAKLLLESKKRYNAKNLKRAENFKVTKTSNKGPRLKYMSRNPFKYYQCQQCFACRSSWPGYPKHFCILKRDAKECPKCKYLFARKCLDRHYRKHKQMPSLTREKIIIVPYNPNELEQRQVKPQVSSKEAKIYKCSCGIHFPSKQSVCKHVMKCSPRQKINCEKCTKCGLTFPTNLLVNHVVNHHSNGDSKVVVYNVPTLFKCKDCKSIFLSKLSLRSHISNCDGRNVEKSYSESVNKSKMNSDQHRDTKITLHKCRKCKIHFSSQAMGILHMNVDHEQLPSSTCNKCGLAFFTAHMKEHMYLHNKKKLCQRTDFKVKLLPREKTDKEEPSTHMNKKLNIVNNSPQRSNVKVKLLPRDKFKGGTINKSMNRKPNTVSNSPKPVGTGAVKTKSKVTKCSQPTISNSYDETDREIIEFGKNMRIVRCIKCDVHYCNVDAFRKHALKNHLIIRAIVVCRNCDRRFTKNSLKIHINIHKGKCRYIDKDIPEEPELEEVRDKLSESEVSNKIKDVSDKNEVSNKNKRKETFDTSETPKKRKLREFDEGNDSEISNTTVPVTSTPRQISYDYKLYKCGECKVNFMNQTSCYKHTLNHVPMNPAEYIACKICNFQFRISSLNSHVKKHHSGNFNIDRVLIEEYNCFQGKSPKIDIYYAVDKVQSKLVSTTTDDHDESQSGNDDIDTTKTNDGNPHQSVDDLIQSPDSIEENPSSVSDEAIDAMENSETDCKTADLSEEVEIATSLDDTDENLSEIDEKVPDKDRIETSASKNQFSCSYCDEKFNNNTSKEFHESLDHIDAKKDCPICNKNLNASILNELHLGIKDGTFVCCACNEKFNVDDLLQHAFRHKTE